MPVILNELHFPSRLIPVDKNSDQALTYLREQTSAKNDRELVELALFLLETVKKEESQGRKIYAG